MEEILINPVRNLFWVSKCQNDGNVWIPIRPINYLNPSPLSNASAHFSFFITHYTRINWADLSLSTLDDTLAGFPTPAFQSTQSRQNISVCHNLTFHSNAIITRYDQRDDRLAIEIEYWRKEKKKYAICDAHFPYYYQPLPTLYRLVLEFRVCQFILQLCLSVFVLVFEGKKFYDCPSVVWQKLGTCFHPNIPIVWMGSEGGVKCIQIPHWESILTWSNIQFRPEWIDKESRNIWSIKVKWIVGREEYPWLERRYKNKI